MWITSARRPTGISFPTGSATGATGGPNTPAERSSPPLAGTATPIYYMDAETIRKAAEKMGREEDAAKYGKLAQDIRKAYNEKYYHPQTREL